MKAFDLLSQEDYDDLLKSIHDMDRWLTIKEFREVLGQHAAKILRRQTITKGCLALANFGVTIAWMFAANNLPGGILMDIMFTVILGVLTWLTAEAGGGWLAAYNRSKKFKQLWQDELASYDKT